ncbi:MAG TPA: class I lanthipeptide [Chitinophaga sp.]|uniref:class I lanthipeptide n=1 Tax=Chitinophaga sp. TaxID=1869181 RepID=UPI002D07F167|nr:class I lanthipeptide [Chitinophaga sp.]HVI46070.1 class I lanthipeptide [Chitinophaga sp.]
MKKQTFKKLSLSKMKIASLSIDAREDLKGGTGTGPIGAPGGPSQGYPTTGPVGPTPPAGYPCQISNGTVAPCCPI